MTCCEERFLFSPLFSACQTHFPYIRHRSFIRHVSAFCWSPPRTGCSLPLPLPLCLFSASCRIGSINKTTLEMKVQTLGDASSLTSCSLSESLSTNGWAGPQEVAICGHGGGRVLWARRLRLMCYLEQMRYVTGKGGGCEDANGETGRKKNISRGEQRAKPGRNGPKESQAPWMRGGGEVDEKRPDEAFAPALHRTRGSAITRVLAAGRSGCSVWLHLPAPWCQVHLLPTISSLSSAALHVPANRHAALHF